VGSKDVHGGEELEDQIERRVSERLLERRLFDVEQATGTMRSDLNQLAKDHVEIVTDVKMLPSKVTTAVQQALKDERKVIAESSSVRNARLRGIVTAVAAVIAALSAAATAIAGFAHTASAPAAVAPITATTPYPNRTP
jgi:precorrin isomerase